MAVQNGFVTFGYWSVKNLRFPHVQKNHEILSGGPIICHPYILFIVLIK